jgi:ADP-ribose pyrophosphatase YjhB (NUDIX family)
MEKPEIDNPLWPRAAASAAIFREDRILLAQRSKPPLKGVWSLPGGHIEPGEKAHQTALRELREETGITANLRGLVDVVDVILRHDDGSLRAQYVISVYYGVWLKGEAQPQSDCMAVEWGELSKMRERPMTEGTADIIDRAAALLKGNQLRPEQD